jgi:hypothetical protein
MNRLLTVVFVLLAIPVMAQDESEGIPFTYDCKATKGVKIEEDFCDLLLMGMLRTDILRTVRPSDEGSLKMAVLPLQDKSNPEKIASSIVMGITFPRDKNAHILTYQRIDIFDSEDVHNDELIDVLVSRCVGGVIDWLKRHVGDLPEDEFAALKNGSSI